MKNILLLLLLTFGLQVFAQQDKPLVQFSGVIYDSDSNSVVPYVTIRNLSEKEKGFVANYKGYFSFVVHEGDSILFTSIGYKSLELTIPKGLPERKFTAIIKIKADNIELPMVNVFPWASVDDFTREFLALKIADDDLETAKKNLSQKSLRELYRTLPRDGGEYNISSFNNNHMNLSNQNMVQTNPLLNPFAWSAFIKQITDGKKAREKD